MKLENDKSDLDNMHNLDYGCFCVYLQIIYVHTHTIFFFVTLQGCSN